MYNLGSNDRENIISHNCNVRERAGFCCDSICDLIMTLKTYCSSCCLLVGSTQPSFLFRWQSGCYGPSELRALPSIPRIREWIWERGEGFGGAREADSGAEKTGAQRYRKRTFRCTACAFLLHEVEPVPYRCPEPRIEAPGGMLGTGFEWSASTLKSTGG